MKWLMKEPQGEIVLNETVHCAFAVSGSKKKKLGSTAVVNRRIYRLEIHCKDFRVHWFNFWHEIQQDAIALVNMILKCVFSAAVPKAMRFSVRVPSVVLSPTSDHVIRFNSESDWCSVLERLSVTKFKVVSHNSLFQLSQRLPECFVVPASMSFDDVKLCAEKFIGGFSPLWSYTHSNGASLVRMSFSLPGLDKDIENQMLQHVKKSCSTAEDPLILNLTNEMPSLEEISASHNSLCRLVMPTSLAHVWRTDRSWYSSLEASHWLSVVGQCLSVAYIVASKMADQQQTIVLKEREAVDLIPLIASLVQLLLDPYSRKIGGFQELIDREWVALGHRFNTRYSTMSDEQSPVFLLFLDCVAQLRYQFPAEFEFSEVYLVRVWDSLCSGAFRTFAFDSVHDYHLALCGNQGNGIPRQQNNRYGFHPSAWDWSVQFNDAQVALNFEPLYVAKQEVRDLNSPDAKTGALATNGDRTLTRPNKQIALKPSVSSIDIKLWSLCYLRWISPVAIVGGGTASEYLTQCLLVEEIHSLRGRIADCESSLRGRGGNADRRRSMLVFGGRTCGYPDDVDGNDGDWNSPLNESLPEVSSSFPFIDCKANLARYNLSVDAYCEGTSFRTDFSGDDDESFATGIESTQSDSFVVINENDAAIPSVEGDNNGDV